VTNLQNRQTIQAAEYIYKKMIQSKKWAEGLNRHFSKEDRQMAKSHENMLNITNYKRNETQN